MDAASVLAGVLGFWCFDALRIYAWESKKFFEEGGGIRWQALLVHLGVVATTSVLVGLVVGVIVTDFRNGIWVGFSAPTSLASFLNPGSKLEVVEDDADNEPEERRTRVARFLQRHYGRYRP